MKSRKILVTLSQTPYGQNGIVENLRTALGLTAGYKEHKVEVLFTQDAVYFLNMAEKNPEIEKFIKSLTMLSSGIMFDEKAVKDRKIGKEMVKEPFRLVSRTEILKLYKGSELTVGL